MKSRIFLITGFIVLGLSVHAHAQTFNSGSTGADGAFSPSVNTTLQLPPNGVFNFTTVNIPTGITVKFLKNSANTPVTILASGNVTVAGTIDVSGGAAAASGAAGDGNLGDDGQPGIGGPGGFNGGFGGPAGTAGSAGGAGFGPGGGGPGIGTTSSPVGGSGGGYGGQGGGSGSGIPGGLPYGTVSLLPLIGGSGGGGGAGGSNFAGAGGGGGGGAILIASSGTISITGSILANGALGGTNAGVNYGGCGGSGSGGGIRLVANTISGNGTITANGGAGVTCNGPSASIGGSASVGRIRLEANTITRTAATTPAYTTGPVGAVFVPGNPTLRITSVAGTAAPDNPTGSADITLPSSTINPVTVTLAASGIPIGTAITVTVVPTTGAKSAVTSTALSGTIDASTASAGVTLPSGPSVLSASATFTLTQTAANDFPVFADGERVEKVRVAAAFGGKSSVVYITTSGREIPAESLR